MKPFGLHVQVLVVSAFLALIPITGIWLMERQHSVLMEAQREALAQKANIIAATLAAASELEFEIPADDTLYAHPLDNWIDIDGRADDWGEVGEKPVTFGDVELTIGRTSTDLFLFAQVKDNSVVYRETLNPSVHRNDYMQIATVDSVDGYTRYTFAAVQPGPVDASVVTSATTGSRAIRTETRIEAYWLATEQGYNIEIRVPVELITSRFAFAVMDVDDPATRQPLGITGSSGSTSDPAQIGSLYLPSKAILDALTSFDSPTTQLVLTDPRGRAITDLGERGSGIFHGYATNTQMQDDTRRLIEEAPVIRNGETVAIIFAEESVRGLQSLHSDNLRRTWQASVLVIITGVLALLTYATLLQRRILRIGKNLGGIVDAQGKVREEMPTLSARDELGELSHTIAQTTNRLREYNRYLEEMSKRLAHELRTPVTVIRSSLENMSLGDDTSRYIGRAQEGVDRLSTILTNMTEATRLEESLRSTEPEYFDLVEVVSGCTEGYRIAYPGTVFELNIEGEFEKLPGLPEVIAQMLDKLVGNAVGFARADTPIRIRLSREGEDAVLRVSNEGPPLPAELEDRLFESMISARSEKDGEPHLGLGLFVARLVAEYHGGSIAATNREDTAGVVVTVRLPLFRIIVSSAS